MKKGVKKKAYLNPDGVLKNVFLEASWDGRHHLEHARARTDENRVNNPHNSIPRYRHSSAEPSIIRRRLHHAILASCAPPNVEDAYYLRTGIPPIPCTLR
eukprot:TRINITY_DN16510_c0_g1::TRINITY_DN16510_c0_g1_i1::g.1914::m.1914 TRINITY_DN16510_c0_g1::TRINITY_DN16510_c0_g1_i1::g.1914  ORF type:complete len:100 (-),score=3.30 TRINITY_DN16510_c0_g1_i1:4-303(-)